MDKITQATVAAILDKINNLGNAELSRSYFYHSLPLCVIDAVFSIGVKYKSVENVIEAWCVAQGANRPRYWQDDTTERKGGMTISEFIHITNEYNGIELSKIFFGNNRQRTSSREGILKADAVVRFAKELQKCGIEDFPDVRCDHCIGLASEAVRSVPGQGSGISFDYFMMLAGDDYYVKPDRMIRRFVAKAANLPHVSPAEARAAVIGAHNNLVTDFRNLTPRLLDHIIWSHESTIASNRHESKRCRT